VSLPGCWDVMTIVQTLRYVLLARVLKPSCAIPRVLHLTVDLKHGPVSPTRVSQHAIHFVSQTSFFDTWGLPANFSHMTSFSLNHRLFRRTRKITRSTPHVIRAGPCTTTALGSSYLPCISVHGKKNIASRYSRGPLLARRVTFVDRNCLDQFHIRLHCYIQPFISCSAPSLQATHLVETLCFYPVKLLVLPNAAFQPSSPVRSP
jgi:hypothetical protein